MYESAVWNCVICHRRTSTELDEAHEIKIMEAMLLICNSICEPWKHLYPVLLVWNTYLS